MAGQDNTPTQRFQAEAFQVEQVTMIDHTPGSAVSAGEVVVIGSTPHIAHKDIEANKLGAVGAGDGVYWVQFDATQTNGARTNWDNTAKKVTATTTSNTDFGIVVQTATGADGYGLVLHKPNGTSG